MYIIWGKKFYGKVDEIPELFYVATKFGHLWFIPLVPVSSHVIFSKTLFTVTAAPIPLSSKSVLVVYFRMAASVLGAIGAAMVIDAVANSTGGGVVCPAAAALFFFGLVAATFFVPFVRTPSYERAVEYSRLVGLSPIGNVRIEVYYGNIPEEEGRQLIADLQRNPSPMAQARRGSTPAAPMEPIELEP